MKNISFSGKKYHNNILIIGNPAMDKTTVEQDIDCLNNITLELKNLDSDEFNLGYKEYNPVEIHYKNIEISNFFDQPKDINLGDHLIIKDKLKNTNYIIRKEEFATKGFRDAFTGCTSTIMALISKKL